MRRVVQCLPAVVLALAVLALYAQTLGFGLLRFDDPDYTVACAFVRDGLTWANVREALTNLRHGGIWMPLTYLSYMCDISLLGGSSAAFHLTNVLLHALAAVLLWRLLVRVCGDDSRPLAFAAVAFWALHPQRVEAVAWVAARKELLWSCWALGGLAAWARGRRAAATLCMACACLSKPTAMVFPALALAVDLCRPARPAIRWRGYVPLLLLSVVTGAVAVYSQTHPEGMAAKELFTAPLAHRLVNAVNAVGLYLAQAVVPAGIHFDYRSVPEFLPLGWPIGLVMGVGVIGALGSLGFLGPLRTLSTLLTLWTLGTLAPTLGIFGSFGEQARADRFWYFASMGLSLGAVLVVPPSRRRVVAFALLGGAAAFSAVTAIRTADYRNDRTVFERTLACDPQHGRALAHVGEAKCAAGDLESGIADLRTSRAVRPRLDTDAKLAYALMRRGRREDWAEIRAVTASVAADPARDEKGQALEALGTAELVAGEWRAAADHLTRSVTAPRRFYASADARLKLAYALHNVGRREEADRLFAEAYKSGRVDLSEKAEQAITAIADDPQAVLFW